MRKEGNRRKKERKKKERRKGLKMNPKRMMNPR
jgi:hypothetical protein